MTLHQTVTSIALLDHSIAAISVNCMSVHKAEDVYARILQGIQEAYDNRMHQRDTKPIIYPGDLEALSLACHILESAVQSACTLKFHICSLQMLCSKLRRWKFT
jgi:hypothetical protein